MCLDAPPSITHMSSSWNVPKRAEKRPSSLSLNDTFFEENKRLHASLILFLRWLAISFMNFFIVEEIFMMPLENQSSNTMLTIQQVNEYVNSLYLITVCVTFYLLALFVIIPMCNTSNV